MNTSPPVFSIIKDTGDVFKYMFSEANLLLGVVQWPVRNHLECV